MTRREFIQQMQHDFDANQKAKNLAAAEKLHDAEVIRAQGPTFWEEVCREVENAVVEIGRTALLYVRDVATSPNQFSITNEASEATLAVKFDPNTAGIEFSGSSGGGFSPEIHGNRLEYSAELGQAGNLRFAVKTIGAHMTAEKVAEKLIAIAVKG